MSMASTTRMFNHAKPYLAVTLMQFSYSLMSIISKHALNEGLSQHVLVAYRMFVAAVLITPFAMVLERNTRPRMTLNIFTKIMLLSLFEPVLSQNLYFTGMKYTSTTFTVAMCNILPALTFIMASIFSQAKVLGTIVAVVGAMTMTLLKGPILDLPWLKVRHDDYQSTNDAHKEDHLMIGAIMIIAGCFCWSCFIILQAFILKSYPSELSLTALVCIISSVESIILAFAAERGNTKIWSIHLDAKLLAVAYGGIVSCSAYFVMGWLMKKRGPVFVSSFNPLGMVIIAILGPLLLHEELYLGRIVGAVVIIIGLYMVLWGRSKDQTSSQTDEQRAIRNGEIEIPPSEVNTGR